jgi:hypothetical protein
LVLRKVLDERAGRPTSQSVENEVMAIVFLPVERGEELIWPHGAGINTYGAKAPSWSAGY